MKKQKIANIIFLIFIVSIIAFFSLSYTIIEEKSFSENENRVLQTSPKISISKLLNGTYTHQLHNYFSDQINMRTKMIECKALLELLMGKKENNGVLRGCDEYLIETPSYTQDNYELLRKNLYKIEKLIKNLKENDIGANSVIIPRKVDILQDYFPKIYSNKRNQTIWNLVSENHTSLKNTLYDAQSNGVQVFYKTDHHWTTEGAYFAYQEIANILGYIPYPIDNFSLISLSNEFYGTNYSKSGFFFTDSEEIKAPRIKNGRYKVTIVDTGAEFDTLYDMAYLNKKDKYSIFLSGNNAHVKIYDTENCEKETLLIIKDSFSHSLAPYLCEHYNLELIDPRYYIGSIENYISQNSIKNVLFLFGIDTLAIANLSIK